MGHPMVQPRRQEVSNSGSPTSAGMEAGSLRNMRVAFVLECLILTDPLVQNSGQEMRC